MAKTWSWRQEPELMERLRNVQNDPANEHQDILTIVGFFESREELERHVVRYELKALVEA
jgi:hypothetical protein